jgi:hypothetical protein
MTTGTPTSRAAPTRRAVRSTAASKPGPPPMPSASVVKAGWKSTTTTAGRVPGPMAPAPYPA